MKKIKVLIWVYTLFIMSGCMTTEDKATKDLKDPKFRSELFQQILTNTTYMSEFSEKMSSNEKGKIMCTMTIPLLRMALESEKMDSMINADKSMMETMVKRIVHKMESDTNTCSMMCGRVMENALLKAFIMKQACDSITPYQRKK